MKSAYRYLAYVIALEVVIQAAAIAFAFFGFGKWIDDGNTFDKAVMEDRSAEFTGVLGFLIHGINGQMVIPLLAIILLIVSFFAKIPGGTKWALVLVVAIAAQVALGLIGGAYLGLLHGANAIFILGVAVMAAKRIATGTSSHLASERV